MQTAVEDMHTPIVELSELISFDIEPAHLAA